MTKRSCSPQAEALLMQEVQVLNLGFVQPIDYMGVDTDVVQAARVSYGPSPRTAHDDRGLLRYLMRMRHSSPFEMCEVKFRCKMPIFVARQWIRHRTSNTNEISYRYTEAEDCFFVPALEQVSLQSTVNKQGRGEPLLDAELHQRVIEILQTQHDLAFAAYEVLAQEIGLARELARVVLPVSLYTQWIWKIDLHNLFHFLGLRLDPHAQLEIRLYAEAMANFVKSWVPLCWEAFEDYRLRGVNLSRQEHEILLRRLGEEPLGDSDLALLPSKREREEFFQKFPGLKKPA